MILAAAINTLFVLALKLEMKSHRNTFDVIKFTTR